MVSDICLYSESPGAAVYLVSKSDFDSDPDIINDQNKLMKYRVPEGNTSI